MRRFLQLFLFATALVLIPTFLFVSHSSYENVEFQPLGAGEAAATVFGGAGRLFHPLGQNSQGRQPDGAGRGQSAASKSGKSFFEQCLMNAGVQWSKMKECWDERKKAKAAEAKQAEIPHDAPSEAAPLKAIMSKMTNETAK